MNEEQPNALDKIGGRKFVMSVLAMVSLIIIASLNPASLTTELVAGIIGVLATFSGSNAFLTNVAARYSGKAPEAQQEQQESPEAAGPAQIDTSRIDALEQRVAVNENNTQEIINVLKMQQDQLNRLTSTSLRGNVNQEVNRGSNPNAGPFQG